MVQAVIEQCWSADAKERPSARELLLLLMAIEADVRVRWPCRLRPDQVAVRILHALDGTLVLCTAMVEYRRHPSGSLLTPVLPSSE